MASNEEIFGDESSSSDSSEDESSGEEAPKLQQVTSEYTGWWALFGIIAGRVKIKKNHLLQARVEVLVVRGQWGQSVYSVFADESAASASGQNEEVKGQAEQVSPVDQTALPNTQDLFGADSSYVCMLEGGEVNAGALEWPRCT